ncbi:2Fe-2S iron-sulfur cluster-binding protein [Kibdelosporangium philippinense]|uniref:2Fe-2S iron-sulfur cluster-binding protein n=1 Tax=Kibdelosporangium philippinense TaxID=211113 RepID=A0ABS8ZES7_9PSEU|nr:2Fe-2S iron-sulfur cluster-binding protein [Kibdelosporangium philippinense]MCE7005028.1 2Fe-2S iron-sulfur cluster-binding protein [Kibdelosporangium philippinense]
MRLSEGGSIDRTKPLHFTLDDVSYTGFEGDTLASAMLANGIIEVAPSLYKHRPRGVFAAGVEEPNALVQVGSEPSLQAMTVKLTDGLVARTLSGIGRLTADPEEPRYDKRFTHTDVLVIGAGPAGRTAAKTAASGGARVILVKMSYPSGNVKFRGTPSGIAVAEEAGELRILHGATAFGYYDSNYVLVAQHQTLWHIRARRVILATGAHEQPIVFENNDRPGIMLAGAVRTYITKYAVLPGRKVVVFTTNDSAYGTVAALVQAGAEVTVVDSRPTPPDLAPKGVEVISGVITNTEGSGRITAVSTEDRRIECDLLAVSGGWQPAVHLFSQSRGTLRWNGQAFVPDQAAQANRVIGAANGTFNLEAALIEAAEAGAEAANLVGYPVPDSAVRASFGASDAGKVAFTAHPVLLVPGNPQTQFVDLQRDATVADVQRAVAAGMRSPEHVKRYTTIGTGADQGRTSNIPALGVIAAILDTTPGELGTTTFRAPSVPVSFALMAGRDRGKLHDPVRTTPIHSWHVRHTAEFENVGQWKRPWFYPRENEDMEAAVLRECHAARTGVGMQDASTLGKIEVVGTDAGEFLNRMYTNAFKKLAVGSARYGLMCKADGMVFDDGVTMRLADDRYYVTTTTGGAANVLDWFEEWSQTEWPELDVRFTSVTEQWSTIAVVGPQSRAVIGLVAPELDVSNDAFPFMTFRETTLVNGIPARIARISFSGELAFEVNVASWYGLAAWEAIYEEGKPYDITPYGTETMHVLRAEKGFPIVGQDTDGTVTPHDLGMSWIVSKQKHFVGKRSLSRPDTARPDRKHLVGLLPVDPTALLPEGAQMIAEGTDLTPPVPMEGHVTSSYRSAALERTFALALIRNGRNRIGETLLAPLGDRVIAATVTEPVFYDKEGARRDG